MFVKLHQEMRVCCTATEIITDTNINCVKLESRRMTTCILISTSEDQAFMRAWRLKGICAARGLDVPRRNTWP